MQLIVVAPRAEEGVQNTAALAHNLFAGLAENSPGHRRRQCFREPVPHLLPQLGKRILRRITNATFDLRAESWEDLLSCLPHPPGNFFSNSRQCLFDGLNHRGSYLRRHLIARRIYSRPQKTRTQDGEKSGREKGGGHHR